VNTRDVNIKRASPFHHAHTRVSAFGSQRRGVFDTVRIEALGASARVADVNANSALARLVSEDTSWQISMASWRHRRPAWWHRQAYTTWLDERVELAQEKSHILALATDIGIAVRPV
jgi:hypothetical protein